MNLKYAATEYLKVRAERKDAQRREDYYRREILRQCPESCTVHKLRVTWHVGSKLDTNWMKNDGIPVESYRVPTDWTARLTKVE